MKKEVLIGCLCAASTLFAGCSDLEEGTVKGDLVTVYNTTPSSAFSTYQGEKEAVAAKLLRDFMTDENRKYWESFEISAHFDSYEEYASLKKKQEKECIVYYKNQVARLETEDLYAVFDTAPDSCVFTGKFTMSLGYFDGADYDTLFAVERPKLMDSKWLKTEGSGTTNILSIEFTDESNVQLERDTEPSTERVKYTRTGSDIYLKSIAGDTLYRLHLLSIRRFEIYDTMDNKYGEFDATE